MPLEYHGMKVEKLYKFELYIVLVKETVMVEKNGTVRIKSLTTIWIQWIVLTVNVG